MQAEASERCAQLIADENFLAEHMLESGKFHVEGKVFIHNNGKWKKAPGKKHTINAKPELHCAEVEEKWRFGLRLVPIDDNSQADVFVIPSNTFVTAFRRLAH